jgi:membrane protein required for beta-lactamase induction
MHVFVWLLFTLIIGIIFGLIWLSAAKNIQREKKWILFTPFWMFTYGAYEKDGLKICGVSITCLLVISLFLWFLQNGYIARG